jgi:hypothetical protein
MRVGAIAEIAIGILLAEGIIGLFKLIFGI